MAKVVVNSSEHVLLHTEVLPIFLIFYSIKMYYIRKVFQMFIPHCMLHLSACFLSLLSFHIQFLRGKSHNDNPQSNIYPALSALGGEDDL